MLAKQAMIFTIIAIAAAALTLLGTMEPKFAQAGGGAVALGLVAAGFAIAAALARR